MADNLYVRVKTLPERLEKARARLTRVTKIMKFVGSNATKKDLQTFDAAQRRVRSLENEARQYNFMDLLGVDDDQH